jgi:hypothetical protein
MPSPIYLKIPGTDLYRHEGDCVNGRFQRVRTMALRTMAQWLALATQPPRAPVQVPSQLPRLNVWQELRAMAEAYYPRWAAKRTRQAASPSGVPALTDTLGQAVALQHAQGLRGGPPTSRKEY